MTNNLQSGRTASDGSNAGTGWREQITPCFFGEQDSRLYGCHHYPATSSSDREAAVICNATAHEYERCHRAMRQLAIQLAKSDRHAMRFDYFGSGDSAGDYTQLTLAQCRKDINQAIDECLGQSGNTSVCLIGVRLGATLAAQVAAQRTDVTSLVLFAPVVNSETLLNEWQQEQAKHDRVHGRTSHTANPQEILGFPLTSTFQQELASEIMLSGPGPGLRRILVLTENESDADKAALKKLVATLGSGNARVDVEPANSSAIWRQKPDKAMVPFKLLRRIISWLNED